MAVGADALDAFPSLGKGAISAHPFRAPSSTRRPRAGSIFSIRLRTRTKNICPRRWEQEWLSLITTTTVDSTCFWSTVRRSATPHRLALFRLRRAPHSGTAFTTRRKMGLEDVMERRVCRGRTMTWGLQSATSITTVLKTFTLPDTAVTSASQPALQWLKPCGGMCEWLKQAVLKTALP
jgi:hypothetical protein